MQKEQFQTDRIAKVTLVVVNIFIVLQVVGAMLGFSVPLKLQFLVFYAFFVYTLKLSYTLEFALALVGILFIVPASLLNKKGAIDQIASFVYLLLVLGTFRVFIDEFIENHRGTVKNIRKSLRRLSSGFIKK